MTDREREARRRVRQIPELRERLQRMERASSAAREHRGFSSRLLMQRMTWVHDQLRLAERALKQLQEISRP